MKSFTIIFLFLSLVSLLPWPVQSQSVLDSSASVPVASETADPLVPGYDFTDPENKTVEDRFLSEGQIIARPDGQLEFPIGSEVLLGGEGQIEDFASPYIPPYVEAAEAQAVDESQYQGHDPENQSGIPYLMPETRVEDFANTQGSIGSGVISGGDNSAATAGR